jgi:hypothetical protein
VGVVGNPLAVRPTAQAERAGVILMLLHLML